MLTVKGHRCKNTAKLAGMCQTHLRAVAGVSKKDPGQVRSRVLNIIVTASAIATLADILVRALSNVSFLEPCAELADAKRIRGAAQKLLNDLREEPNPSQLTERGARFRDDADRWFSTLSPVVQTVLLATLEEDPDAPTSVERDHLERVRAAVLN